MILTLKLVWHSRLDLIILAITMGSFIMEFVDLIRGYVIIVAILVIISGSIHRQREIRMKILVLIPNFNRSYF